MLIALEGSGSPDVAGADRDLADALQMTGHIAEAIATDQAAVAIYEHMGSDGDVRLGPALDDLCAQLLVAHRAADALPLARRALAVIEQRPADANPQDLADAKFTLAQVLWETCDRAGAHALAVAAEQGAVDPDHKKQATDWLAAHAVRVAR